MLFPVEKLARGENWVESSEIDLYFCVALLSTTLSSVIQKAVMVMRFRLCDLLKFTNLVIVGFHFRH